MGILIINLTYEDINNICAGIVVLKDIDENNWKPADKYYYFSFPVIDLEDPEISYIQIMASSKRCSRLTLEPTYIANFKEFWKNHENEVFDEINTDEIIFNKLFKK